MSGHHDASAAASSSQRLAHLVRNCALRHWVCEFVFGCSEPASPTPFMQVSAGKFGRISTLAAAKAKRRAWY
eukprot:3423834-Rhodomonas_salina.2